MPRRVDNRRSFKPEFYVRSYQLAKEGMTDAEIARALGVSPNTYENWVSRDQTLKDALMQARRNRSSKERHGETFQEYVYDRLPSKLQDLWNKLEAAEKETNGVRKAEFLLDDCATPIRMQLFFHALVQFNFNASRACRIVGISRSTLNLWIETEAGFAELIDEFFWHKKNFFEDALVDLVRRRDSAAVIFANKTLNRDRGYNEKIDVNLTGQLDVDSTQVKVADLDLSLDQLRDLRDRIRDSKQKRADVKLISVETNDGKEEAPKNGKKR